MEVIGCIPPYWRIFMRDHNQLSNCTSTQQLRSAARYLPYKNQLNDEIFSQYHPPCYRMRVTANTNKDAYTDSALLKIKFRYRWDEKLNMQYGKYLKTFMCVYCYLFYSSDYFQETTNVRKFSRDSVWGNVGGYIGMFLGFSVLQIPSLLNAVFRRIKDKYTSSNAIKIWIAWYR